MNSSRIFLSPPHMSGHEQRYIQEAFETNWIAPLGPNVDAFEQEMARYVGAGEAIAVSSGTAAIHLALSLLDVGTGDRVFCSTLTFVASANPILYCGATPVFIDSEPETWNMSPQALKTALEDAAVKNQLPKAVIVVHLYGQSAKMDELLTLCDAYGIPVIEDAAESLGSSFHGKASGTLGRFGIYSFNGNKIITTSGGGMLVSDDVVAIQRARFLATQAKDPLPYYQHSKMGFNYRMSNLLAGVGRAQLEVLPERVAARRSLFERYEEAFRYIPGVTMMPEMEGTISNRWLTALTINDRQTGVAVTDLLDAFSQANIEARHVWKPLHLQPLFEEADYYPHEPGHHVAEQLFRDGICLPSGSSMTEEEHYRVIQCMREALSGVIRIRDIV